MAEHYTNATVQAASWCAKCQKTTMHNVTGRRLGACRECIARLDQRRADEKLKTPAAKQERMF